MRRRQLRFSDRAGGVVLAYALQQQTLDSTPDNTFRDLLDVAGIAVPLALVILLAAVSWPGIKRWVRHRVHRRRRRRNRDAHAGTSRLP